MFFRSTAERLYGILSAAMNVGSLYASDHHESDRPGNRPIRVSVVGLVVVLFAGSAPVGSAQQSTSQVTVFRNVMIFDGLHDRLAPGSVLVENNLIVGVGDEVQVPDDTVTTKKLPRKVPQDPAGARLLRQ